MASPAKLTALLRTYLALRHAGEPFVEFTSRHTVEELDELVRENLNLAAAA